MNVWTYELDAYATAPDAPVTQLNPSECADIRKRFEQLRGPNYYYGRVAECWVRPGDALVTIYVEGKIGWW